MGASVSKGGEPSYRPVVSRERLLAMTQQPRELITEIFKAMVDKLTPNDILALSDPKVCPKYVFFMSDAIKQSFLQLRLRPKKDKQGVIYYASVEELQGKGKDPVLTDKEFNNHCLSVAFFYVRIFQIFGALALSVTDDVTVGRSVGTIAIGVPRGAERGAIGGPRGTRPGTGWFGFGGSMGNEFMAEFQSYGSTVYKIMENYSKIAPYISKYGPTEESRNPANPSEDVDIFTYRFDSDSSIQLIVRVKVSQNQQQQYGAPYFGAYEYQRQQQRTSVPEVTILFESPKQDKESKKFYIRGTFSYIGTTGGQPKFQLGRLEKRISGSSSSSWSTLRLSDTRLLSKEIRLDSVDPGDVLRKYFDSVVESHLGQLPGAPGAPGVTVPQTDPLATDFIIKEISAKQVSFASARALQLLNIDALVSDKVVAESRICYDNFKDFREFVNLPKSGQGLGSVPAFRAMEILFFNDLRVAPDNKFSLMPGSQLAYTEFLNRMKATFGKSGGAGAGTDPTKTRLENIKMDSVACGSKNKVVPVPKEKVKLVRQKVQALLGIQAAHTSRVVQFILKNLVTVSKTPAGRSFVLHPKLFAGGISEIDRVAKEARELLLKHYEQAEKVYQAGVAEIPK